MKEMSSKNRYILLSWRGISGFVLEFPIRVTVDSSEPLKTVLRNVYLGNLYTQSGFSVFLRVLLDYNP